MTTTTATLRLRVRHGRVTARVLWPDPHRDGRPILLAVLDADRARRLCEHTERIVLALSPTTSGEDLWDVARWAASHAGELGARIGAVALVGDGKETLRELAALAGRARDDGWPNLSVQSTSSPHIAKDGT